MGANHTACAVVGIDDVAIVIPHQPADIPEAFHTTCAVGIGDTAKNTVKFQKPGQPADHIITGYTAANQSHIAYSVIHNDTEKADIICSWPIDGEIADGVAQAVEGAGEIGG